MVRKSKSRARPQSEPAQQADSTRNDAFLERVSEKFQRDAAPRLAEYEEWRRQSRRTQANV